MTYLLVMGGFLFYWFWGCSQIVTPSMSSNASPPSIQGSSQSPELAAVPSPLVLSILSFEDRTRLPQLAWLRKGLSDMLITDLSQAPEIQIVQRERLEEIVREQALQAGGRIDDKTAVRLGRLTGATVILLGSATLVGDTLRLDAHLLSVERGTVFGAAFVEGRAAELLSLEKHLAARLLTLLRVKQSVHLPTKTASEPSVLKATGAFYEGLDAADRGDIDKALDKFEIAIAQDPKYAEAVKRYERTARAVDRTTLRAPGAAPLLREKQQYRLGIRLADELVRETVVAEPQQENAEETTAGSKFSVVLRFDQQAVSRWLEEVRPMGGSAVEQNGRLIVRLEPSDVQAAFATALAVPRRLFLHVPSAAGRDIAVYSQLQHWQGEDWISLDREGRVVLQLHRQMVKAIVLPEGVLNTASLPKQFQVSFDPVPREQAIIKVELVGINEEHRDVILSPRPLRHFPRGEVPDKSSWQFVDEARDQLEHEIKKLWNPPVSEAVPRPGYLPSARRTVMVATSITAGHLGSVFIVDSSGDSLSDSACLTAVSGVDLTLSPLLAHLEKTTNGAVRLRIHCHLVKDNPPL